MDAANILIPDGVVFRRIGSLGDGYEAFDEFNWPGKPARESYKRNYNSPIFLYKSDPYFRDVGSDTRVIQHCAIISVLDVDTSEKLSLQRDAIFEFDVFEHYWSTLPSTINVFDCGYELKDHLYEERDAHCLVCHGDLNFSHLTDMLHSQVTWPFPPKSILAQGTTCRTVIDTSVADLNTHLDTIATHRANAFSLLADMSVDARSATARVEVEQLYAEKVLAIKERAERATQAYSVLRQLGLDTASLGAREAVFSARVKSIENGEAIARLRAEADAIYAKIAALGGNC